MGKSWSLRSDLRGGEQVAKAKEAESPPAPALGHVDLDKAEAKHALKILKANKSEVEGVIDFSGLKDVSKLKRKWQGSSLDVGAGSGDKEEQAVSREGSFFRQTNRSSIIELDSMLQGAMETVEHLLLDATAAACVRVEHVLRMRLQGLAAQGTEVNSPDSPASPKSAKSETSEAELPQRIQKKCFESVTSPGPSLPRAQPVELEVLNDSGQLPAPPPHQRLRSLDEPPGGPRPLGI
ncbi:unnamed protein product [Effrenium voratum]|nr:unnamed protein product [Effrenium voratum]